MPNPERSRFAAAEREAIARAYGGKQAHERASALGQTELVYADWITARTPVFKAWFGDWEAAQARKLIWAMTAVAITALAPDLAALAQGKTEIEALRISAWEKYKEARRKGPVAMLDGREVKLTRVGFFETKGHSADRRPLDLFSNLRGVLGKAIYLTSALPSHQRKASATTRAFHYYGAKVDLTGETLYARLVIRENVNETIYYDNDLSSAEAVTGQGGGAGLNESGAAHLGGDMRTLRQLLDLVNPRPLRTAPNPRTGEPSEQDSRDYER